MKKFIAIAIAVLTVFSFTTVAFAESTTTFTTTVPDAEYTLNIPADQEIPFGATSTDIGMPTVTNASGFASGKNLNVTMTWEDFSCPNTTTIIPFSLKARGYNPTAPVGTEEGFETYEKGDKLVFLGLSSGAVNEVARADERNMTNFYLIMNSADWGKALAGDYTATITFTAEVVAE